MLCYDVPDWDSWQWERFCETHLTGWQVNRDAKVQIATFSTRLPGFLEFCGEIFHRLYSYDALRHNANEVKPEHEWALQLHQALDGDERFVQYQGGSVGHTYVAGMGAVALAQQFAQSLPQPPAPLKDVQELRQAVMGLKRHNADSEMIDALVGQGKQAVSDAQDYAKAIQRHINSGDLANAVDGGIDQANQSVECAQGLGWGLGAGHPNTQSHEKLEDVLRLSAALQKNNKLKKIAQLAGQMKRVAALKQREVSKEARHTLAGLEYGRDMGKVLASELVLAHSATTAPLFYKKYADNELTQLKLRGKERLGNGPLAICLDSSGSMDGLPDIWAKAVTATLLGIAQKQRRNAAVIHYSDGVRAVQEFNYKQPDPKNLIDCLAVGPNGGTNWWDPLKRALKLIAQDRDTYRSADIVFITDGDCDLERDLTQKFNQTRTELKVKVYGIAINSYGDCLNPFCDQVFQVDPQNEIKDIANLFTIGCG